MKSQPVLVLLSSVLLLCGAVPDLDPVTCNVEGHAAAARLAVHDINAHHRHGYKFRLSDVSGTFMEEVDGGCTMELRLNLAETECPHMSTKHFETCGIRSSGDRAVVANCTVMITVKSGVASVDRYECVTRQEMTDSVMVRFCPDCPMLLPLQSPEGLASIHEAIQKINKNASNEHYYILQSVGRILSGYINGQGMFYSSNFFMVETNCPFGSRIVIQACKPLPPARARHAYCSSYSVQGGEPVDPSCEYYPPTDHSDNQDPATPDADSQHGPPQHAHGPPQHAKGPLPHAHGPLPHAHGPPLHAHGPPPHAKGPSDSSDHCKGAVPNSDPAIHPICPKPLPEPKVEPRPAQS